MSSIAAFVSSLIRGRYEKSVRSEDEGRESRRETCSVAADKWGAVKIHQLLLI